MKHEGWINITKIDGTDICKNPVSIYRVNSCVYKDKETALSYAKDFHIATVKIKWED